MPPKLIGPRWLRDYVGGVQRRWRESGEKPLQQRTIGPQRRGVLMHGEPSQARKEAETLVSMIPGGESGKQVALGNFKAAAAFGILDLLPGGKGANALTRKALAREIAEKAAQGFSYHPASGKFLSAGIEGFAVGAGSKEKRLLTGKALQPEQIEKFLTDHADYFEKNPNALLGGWTDDAGTTYIEPSELFTSRKEALKAGVQRGEKAVWDFKSMSEVPVPAGRVDIREGREIGGVQGLSNAQYNVPNGTVEVLFRKNPSGELRVENIEFSPGPKSGGQREGAIGPSAVRAIFKDLKEHTGATKVSGNRISGARPDREAMRPLADSLAKRGAKETIAAASIKLPDGRVFTGRDHSAALEKAQLAGATDESLGLAEDGFQTSSGRVVSREEAYKIHSGKKVRPYEWPPGLMAEEVNFPGSVKRSEAPALTRGEKRRRTTEARVRSEVAPAIASGDPTKGWGTLFDYKSLGKDVLPVEQKAVAGRPVPSSVAGMQGYTKAAEKAAEMLRSPENMRRLSEGLQVGGEKWYYMDPLARSFMDLLGEEEGKRRFELLTKTIAATSPNSEIGRNIRAAGALFPHVLEGLPFSKVPNLNAVLAPGLGNTAHNVQRDLLGRVVGGAESIAKSPLKADSFAQNLMGNFEPATIDRHFFRQAGTPKGPPGYLGTEDAASDLAAELAASGTLPVAEGRAATAPYQAALWIGDALQGRVRSAPRPALSIFEDEIRKAAAAESMTPSQALTKFMQGQLWGFAGGAPGLMRF